MNVHSWNTTLRISMLINPNLESYSTKCGVVIRNICKKREIFAQLSMCTRLMHKTI